MRERYKFGVDIWAAALFLAVMAPNVLWFALPAPDDILRLPSVTPALDLVGSVFQVLAVALLIFVKRRGVPPVRLDAPTVFAGVCYLAYLAGWVGYYRGITAPAVILLLCLAPCLALGGYAAGRKNLPALVALAGFSVCHVAYGVINFC